MSTSKGNSKIIHHTDTQHRISASKRTAGKHLDQTIDANAIIKTQTSSKPESGSEEVPLTNEGIKITRKHRTRHGGGTGDYLYEDADEESAAIRAIMTQTKTTSERLHQFTSPSNNSAIPLQQQGTGDHFHLNTKQHRSRHRTAGKYQQELEERNVDRWRLFMSVVTVLILAFVIHRFLLAIWPRPKKTLMEQFIDNLWNFFTP